jgi:hypothetical protein
LGAWCVVFYGTVDKAPGTGTSAQDVIVCNQKGLSIFDGLLENSERNVRNHGLEHTKL